MRDGYVDEAWAKEASRQCGYEEVKQPKGKRPEEDRSRATRKPVDGRLTNERTTGISFAPACLARDPRCAWGQDPAAKPPPDEKAKAAAEEKKAKDAAAREKAKATRPSRRR
jgi:hypothetical protein